MKIKRVMVILVLFFGAIAGKAQRQFDAQTIELIKTKKIAFLTEQLSLTSAEAEKFWPVYNELEKERFALMGQRREMEQKIESASAELNESECKKLATELASIHVKDGKLIEEYNQRLLGILPACKVVKLYVAEGKFRATLMHEYRKNQAEKREQENK